MKKHWAVAGALLAVAASVAAVLTYQLEVRRSDRERLASAASIRAEIRDVLSRNTSKSINMATVKQVIRLGQSNRDDVVPLLRDLGKDMDSAVAANASVALYWLEAFTGILKQDGQSIDLTGSNLENIDFSDLDLRSANFTGSNLKGATFADSNLVDVNFSECNLTDANFTGAELFLASFVHSDLSGATFNDVNFNNVSFCLVVEDAERCDSTVFSIRSIRGARVAKLSTAPTGFVPWAVARGATTDPEPFEDEIEGAAQDKWRDQQRADFFEEFGVDIQSITPPTRAGS